MERAYQLLRLAVFAESRGNYDQALQAARQAAAELQDASATEPPTKRAALQVRLQAMSLVGNLLCQLAQYAESESALQHALDFAQKNFGDSDEAASIARNQLGVLYKYTGEFDKAESLYRQALKALLGEYGEMHSSVAMIYHNLGGLFHARGDFAAGEPYSRKAWDINRELLGEDDPASLADAAAYAGVLDGLERFNESEPIYERVLEVFIKKYGVEHYEVAVNLNNLANVRFVRGDYASAESLFRQSLEIKEKLLGADHPDSALAANNLGVVLQVEDRKPEARELFERALKTFEASLGSNHPKTIMARANIKAMENDEK